MDLPLELRLIVYKRIRRQIKHIHMSLSPEDPTPRMTLIHHCLPVAILATGKAVRAEAEPTLKRTMQKFISEEPIRIIGHCADVAGPVDWASFDVSVQAFRLVQTAMRALYGAIVVRAHEVTAALTTPAAETASVVVGTASGDKFKSPSQKNY
jgi:hypothetical protein